MKPAKKLTPAARKKDATGINIAALKKETAALRKRVKTLEKVIARHETNSELLIRAFDKLNVELQEQWK